MSAKFVPFLPLVKFNKCYKLFCFLCIISLLSPSSLASVNAATKFVGIDIEQKVVIAKTGDKIGLNPSGYYYEKLFGDEATQCFEDISNVKWTSSNKKIATINSKGVLTAKAPGKCTVTATWKDKKAQCKVRIYTEKELYDHVLFADIAHENIFMALTSDYFKNYDLLYDSETFEEVADKKVQAAKKAKEIINSVVTKDMSDYEKTMAIAEWIINNIQVIHNYKSKFTKGSLREYEKAFYYLDPLLYGKSNERGIGTLFELLLNICGIRSELVINGGTFNTDQGEEINLIFSNVVKLDGEYYYFDIMQISADKQELQDENKKAYSFYDFLIPDNNMVKQFVHITTSKEKEDWIKYGSNPRVTNYDFNGTYYVPLGFTPKKASKYSYYFYDFYNEAIRFVTMKEDQTNKNIGYKPSIPVLPFYPDSTAAKYKNILSQEAAFNSKVVQAANAADALYQAKLKGEPINYAEVSELVSGVTAVETEFASIQSSFANRNLISFIKNKIADTKTLLTKLQ
ncbi:MAG TPA: hypothetical protein GXX75_21975 [Clostridiales bacterium]|nr:hypothetical protein [Clostridiales bacterium]